MAYVPAGSAVPMGNQVPVLAPVSVAHSLAPVQVHRFGSCAPGWRCGVVKAHTEGSVCARGLVNAHTEGSVTALPRRVCVSRRQPVANVYRTFRFGRILCCRSEACVLYSSCVARPGLRTESNVRGSRAPHVLAQHAANVANLLSRDQEGRSAWGLPDGVRALYVSNGRHICQLDLQRPFSAARHCRRIVLPALRHHTPYQRPP